MNLLNMEERIEVRRREAQLMLIEQGRNEAWEAVKKLYEMNIYDLLSLGFSINDSYSCNTNIAQIVKGCSINEVMLAIHAYEERQKKKEKKDKIKVGDEVTFVGDNNTKGIVINAETTHPKIFLGNYTTTCHIGDLIPTGRHFPELGEFLKNLQEGE